MLERKIENRFGMMDDKIEERFQALDEKIDREGSSLAAMDKQGFDEMGQEFKEVREEMNTRFEGVHTRLRNLDNRQDTFTTHQCRIRRLEQEVGIPTVGSWVGIIFSGVSWLLL